MSGTNSDDGEAWSHAHHLLYYVGMRYRSVVICKDNLLPKMLSCTTMIRNDTRCYYASLVYHTEPKTKKWKAEKLKIKKNGYAEKYW